VPLSDKVLFSFYTGKSIASGKRWPENKNYYGGKY